MVYGLPALISNVSPGDVAQGWSTNTGVKLTLLYCQYMVQSMYGHMVVHSNFLGYITDGLHMVW